MAVKERVRTKHINVRIEHDQDTESPLEYDVFELITFNMSSIYDGEMPDDLDPKLEGKAWWLVSCFRHSGSVWFIQGSGGPQCRWDTTQTAGILRLKSNDPSDLGEDPQKQAEGFMDTFT